MSLMATSYRYEIEGSHKNTLQKALARQKIRIKDDENQVGREKSIAADSLTNEISKWTENLEEASSRRRAKREHGEVKEELRLGGKASVKVRRAQLQELLLYEHAQYEKELHSLGLAFHQERL